MGIAVTGKRNLVQSRVKLVALLVIVLLLAPMGLGRIGTVKAQELLWSQTSVDGSANAVVVDSSGLYTVGFDAVSTGRIEKRSLMDGSLIWSATSNPTSHSTFSGQPLDFANGAAVDATGLYVVGVNAVPFFGFEWRLEKRSLSDGSPIWSATSDPTGIAGDAAYGVAVDVSGVYAVGAVSGGQWRIEKRSLGTDNTPAGSSVSVPLNGGLSSTGGVQVTFDTVSTAGTTSATTAFLPLLALFRFCLLYASLTVSGL